MLKKYLESRKSDVVDLMLTLFSQEEIWDMHVRNERKQAVNEAMKKEAVRMLQEQKLEIREV